MTSRQGLAVGEPLVLFPAGGRAEDTEIVSGMRQVLDAADYPVSELPTDDPAVFAAAFSTPRPFLLADVHGYHHRLLPDWAGLGWLDQAPPALGAHVLVLGSCRGAQPAMVRALQIGLSRPTPVLACRADVALFSHGPALWPHVLQRVPDLVAVADDADAAAQLLQDALAAAHAADRRRRLAQKWTVHMLHPLHVAAEAAA